MKLDIPYKMLGQVSDQLVEEALSIIKPDHWLFDTTRNQMGNLEQTQSILLRYFSSYEKSFLNNWNDHIVNKPLYPVYENILEKFLTELQKYYRVNNYMAFFAKLSPNSSVGFHVDSGPFLEKCHRIHIPLKTNSNVFYIIEDVSYNWEKGKIYEFDNTRLHGVKNASNEDRIHLMVNIYE